MFLLTIYEGAKKGGGGRGLEFFYRFFISLYLYICGGVKRLVFLLRFLLTIYGGNSFFNPVARLVGWRVNLRVNLHYPGMEFPIAVVAREIAALWCEKGKGFELRVSKIFAKRFSSL